MSHGGYGYTKNSGVSLDFDFIDDTIDICPDIILSAVAVAGAGFFFLIYTSVTMAGRRRRKKRDLNESLCRPGDLSMIELDQTAAVCHKGDIFKPFILRGTYLISKSCQSSRL